MSRREREEEEARREDTVRKKLERTSHWEDCNSSRREGARRNVAKKHRMVKGKEEERLPKEMREEYPSTTENRLPQAKEGAPSCRRGHLVRSA